LSPTWILSLWEGTTVSSGAEGEVVITCPYSRIVFRHLSASTEAALRRLVHPGERQLALTSAVANAGGPDALARWYYYLQELAQRGFLLLAVHEGSQRLATLQPTVPSFSIPGGGELDDRPHVLSRFAYLRRRGDEVVLESPRSFARVVLHDARAAALIHSLARPGGYREVAGRVPGLSPESTADLIALLFAGGMVVGMTDDGRSTEDVDPALPFWEFHDLLFHARSREGRHDAQVGATYRLMGQLPAPPALTGPVEGAETIELFRPDLDQLQRDDRSFAQVVEERCSVREYAAEPITVSQLGEFLYRAARVKARREDQIETGRGKVPMEFTSRPYPAGGSLYELEVYPLVNACRGLELGLYRYDPLRHQLSRLTDRAAEAKQLIREAAWATGMEPARVQVLLILAARFPRVSWKYSTLAYALTLKHVGVVYQTMYLTATAMGLAPCAVGVGNADVFARAAGTDYYAETSVGEFLLGSRPSRKAGPV
jgi:SagB-type dehydrogenase family enzyme